MISIIHYSEELNLRFLSQFSTINQKQTHSKNNKGIFWIKPKNADQKTLQGKEKEASNISA